MRSKIVVLIVALTLGVFAAFAVGGYLDSAKRRLEAGTRPVAVLVCEKPVAAGMSAEEAVAQGAIVKKDIARQYVAQEAVSAFSKIEGQVCAVSLTPGEQLTQGDFRYATEAGAAYSVPEGHMAVSLRDDPVRGVSGLVKPGDHVAVIATFEERQGDIKTAMTRTVLARARVLAVGRSLTSYESTGEATPASSGGLIGSGAQQATGDAVNTVTLAIRPADVERVVFADDQGTVRLALIGTADDTPAKTRGVRWSDVR